MSLARFALRACAVMALRGATMAQTRVRDSALSDLDALLEIDRAPILTVSTESTERKAGETLPQVRLVIEAALKVHQDQDGEPALGYAETDAELDFMLDLFEREVLDALAAPSSPVADLLRTIAVDVARIALPGIDYSSIRGVGEAGERLAARQILITTNVVLDPVPGDPPPDWLARFLALIEDDGEYAPFHTLLSTFLARSAGAEDFREQARLFLDAAAARALAVTALAHDDAGAPVQLEALEVGPIQAPEDARE